MEDNQRYRHVQFCDHRSILVINSAGKLKQVFTPFRVLSIEASSSKAKWYIVDEVWSTARDELVYIIGGQPYAHHNFTIDIQF